MIKNILVIFFIILYSGNLFASEDGECDECAKRKEELCKEECLLVLEEKKVECFELCIKEYCSHKCPEKEAKE